jgi:hypothetical protein
MKSVRIAPPNSIVLMADDVWTSDVPYFPDAQPIVDQELRTLEGSHLDD